jgi:hypothetical protein
MTCTTYCVKIEEIFDAMICLAPEVLPENRPSVEEYIHWAWKRVTVFVQSIKREKGTEELRFKFESYVTAEEERLQQNLEDLRYYIDNSDTFQVIAGGGRVETVIQGACNIVFHEILMWTHIQTLLPIFYLALKRDLEKISLAQKHILDDYELPSSLDTIYSIVNVAFNQIESLRGKSKS